MVILRQIEKMEKSISPTYLEPNSDSLQEPIGGRVNVDFHQI
jgi:hypothetical protein